MLQEKLPLETTAAAPLQVTEETPDKESETVPGLAPADDFIQKGNPVIPSGMVVKVDGLAPGSYRLVVQAADTADNHAPDRAVDFDVIE